MMSLNVTPFCLPMAGFWSYTVARRELGVPNPIGIFREPEEWLGWSDLEPGEEHPG
jgi:hypothetical protein